MTPRRPSEGVPRELVIYHLERLLLLPPEMRRRILASLPAPVVRAIMDEWWWQAHGGQVEPETAQDGNPWRAWAIVAGRGFGKTRAGAEWIWARARRHSDARIALVAASLDEAARVMVEGESGLLALARSDEEPRWISSRGLLRFPSGAQAFAYSADRPDMLRGPQHHFAWCDELAKWPPGSLHPNGPILSKADAAFDNLMLGLRLGERPRTIVTTTPRPVPLLRRILALPSTAKTQGATEENPHNAPDFPAAMRALYAGTRLALQELDGILLEDFEGALWTRDLIEKSRSPSLRADDGPPPPGGGRDGVGVDSAESHRTSSSPRPLNDFHRILIGLDPPASTHGDSCGIVVCGKDEAGIVHVLADLTAQGLSPEAWARRVADAAVQYGAAKIVAEKNQGGDMIESVLRAVDADLNVKLVAATKSKAARAEPIALRFETGRARLAGHFPELEAQLCALTWAGYQAPGSPDRADAMIWAMTELFEKPRPEPRVRGL